MTTGTFTATGGWADYGSQFALLSVPSGATTVTTTLSVASLTGTPIDGMELKIRDTSNSNELLSQHVHGGSAPPVGYTISYPLIVPVGVAEMEWLLGIWNASGNPGTITVNWTISWTVPVIGSTYSRLIAAIRERVESVPDVGMVHAYQRFSQQMPDYLDHFMVTVDGVDQIRGWVVTLAADAPISAELVLPDKLQRTYQFEIYGVMGLSDETETEVQFLDLVEAIMDAVEGRADLGTVGTYNVEPISMRVYQIRMFGNVLCHYCEIMVPVAFDRGVTYDRG